MFDPKNEQKQFISGAREYARAQMADQVKKKRGGGAPAPEMPMHEAAEPAAEESAEEMLKGLSPEELQRLIALVKGGQ